MVLMARPVGGKTLDNEKLEGLKEKAKALEAEVAKTTIAIHEIQDVDKCESCQTPGQKAKKCTACLGPTTRPPKSDS